MILTERDREILQDLQSYGLLPTQTICSRRFPNVAKTTALRRLRILESSGFIQRIEGLSLGRIAWAATTKAAEKILNQPCKVHYPKFILDHDLRLSELRLKLEEAGIARSWKPEHEIRQRVATKHWLGSAYDKVIPDALMGVVTNDLKETVAIELELSAKNQRRYHSTLREYSRKSSLWGVWYVVRSASIGKQMLSAARPSYSSNEPALMWSLLDDVMKDPLSAVVYERNRTVKVADVWEAKAAHTPAHPVSSKAV